MEKGVLRLTLLFVYLFVCRFIHLWRTCNANANAMRYLHVVTCSLHQNARKEKERRMLRQLQLEHNLAEGTWQPNDNENENENEIENENESGIENDKTAFPERMATESVLLSGSGAKANSSASGAKLSPIYDHKHLRSATPPGAYHDFGRDVILFDAFLDIVMAAFVAKVCAFQSKLPIL